LFNAWPFVVFAFICFESPLFSLPLWFEPNGAHFQARHLLLSPTQAVFQAGESPVVLTLQHANPHARGEALDRLPGISNYYLGNDPAKWRTDVPHFARVRYHDVYPGIDVIYYGNTDGKLEYDFVVQPGANPHRIQIAFNRPVHTTSNGELFVAGLRQHRPKIYQDSREVACDYIVDHEHRVQLALARYDHTMPLTIDPVIEYSTYLGGNANDFATAIAVDANGSAYVTGWLESPKYPNLDPFQQTSGTVRDIVVAKFTPSGNGLIFYTYIGGSGLNDAQALALDPSGNAYVTGFTQSLDFPTKNAAQPSFGGGFENAIVAKVSPDGRLIYSTYLGGNYEERANGIAVDASGAAFVSGYTGSIDFPVKNAIQPRPAGRPSAFLTKLSPTGDKFLFSTYLGGSGRNWGNGLTLDTNGNPILVGETESTDFPLQNPLQSSLLSQHGSPFNGFITKLSSAGDKILYSTYFCGAAQSALDKIALDSDGAIYVLGMTTTSGFPVKNPIQATFGGGLTDLVVAKLTPAGDSIVYATYLGGGDREIAGGLAVSSDGTLYLTGATYSSDFPSKNSIQPFVGSTNSFKVDAVIAKISSSGSLLYSTFIGGNGTDGGTGIAIDSRGAVHISGTTNSNDFPTKNPLQAEFGGGPSDMFYLRLAPEVASPLPFSASPASVQFRYVIGGGVPPSQIVSVTSTGGSLSFSPSATAAWLKLIASSSTTPANLNISVDPSGLQPGTYAGSIQIDSQTSVQVNLTILAPAPTVTSISPASVPIGSNTTVLAISGSGFQQGAVVQLNGAAFPTTFLDSGTLQITMDKSNLTQAATLPFTVVNPQSAPSNPVTFTIGTPAPVFTAAGVVNAATFSGGPVAPGEIITIFGTNLSGGVTFDGTRATLVFASPAQVNVTVPYSVAGPTTTLQMGASSVQLQVAPSAPGIFAAVSAGDNILVLYATGCGALTNDDLPRCALPVSVTVNGESAQVLYAGIAPGLVKGANQINIQLPDDITTGPLTIVLTAGDASSKPFSFTLP
jgi:uncharacterized protein (TIGR03437 family)